MNIIRPKENNRFIYYYLNSRYFYNHVWKDLGTATVNQITKQTLESCYLNIPSVEEQNKISNTLKLLDKKIELQSKKIEDLKLFKKGLFDKLFNEVDGNNYLLSDIASFENGELKDDTPIEELVGFIINTIYGMMLNWCMTDTKYEPQEHLKTTTEYILNGIKPYMKG